jgi:hypothetical protein
MASHHRVAKPSQSRHILLDRFRGRPSDCARKTIHWECNTCWSRDQYEALRKMCFWCKATGSDLSLTVTTPKSSSELARKIECLKEKGRMRLQLSRNSY